MSKHRVIVKYPWERAHVVEVEYDDGRGLATLIGGTPSSCLKAGSIIGYCDDDGIRKGLDVNVRRPTDDAEIHGVLVLCGLQYVDGEPDWGGLDDVQIEDALDIVDMLQKHTAVIAAWRSP